MSDEEGAAEPDGGDGDGDGGDGDDARQDDTVPNVSLDLYRLSVSVSGRAGDDLADVESAARGLMDYLVDQAGQLEDHPDDRGMG